MLTDGLQQGPTPSGPLLMKPPAFAFLFCFVFSLCLLFFMDAIRKGVRLVFCVSISFRPCDRGRMCPCESMSVLASVPGSCTEVIRTERIRETDLAVLRPFQVLPDREGFPSCSFFGFVLNTRSREFKQSAQVKHRRSVLSFWQSF